MFPRLSDVSENTVCRHGFQFKIKMARGVKKQLLVINGKATYAFVKKNKKFTKCVKYRDVTPQVQCKV